LAKKNKEIIKNGHVDDQADVSKTARALASARGTPLVVWVVVPILVVLWAIAAQMFVSFVFSALPASFDNLW
jgi:hypothetical protein